MGNMMMNMGGMMNPSFNSLTPASFSAGPSNVSRVTETKNILMVGDLRKEV